MELVVSGIRVAALWSTTRTRVYVAKALASALRVAVPGSINLSFSVWAGHRSGEFGWTKLSPRWVANVGHVRVYKIQRSTRRGLVHSQREKAG